MARCMPAQVGAAAAQHLQPCHLGRQRQVSLEVIIGEQLQEVPRRPVQSGIDLLEMADRLSTCRLFLEHPFETFHQ